MLAVAQLVHDHLEIRDSAIFLHGLSVLYKNRFALITVIESHSRATGK